jgi:hypothetical protein
MVREIVCVQVYTKGENRFIPMNIYWHFWDSDQVVAVWSIKPHGLPDEIPS